MQSEKLNPIHRLLKFSLIYQTVQNILIKKNYFTFLYRELAEIKTNDKVLDLGCGPAKLRYWIDTNDYIGIDFNPSHIKNAKKNHPNDTFICGNIVSHPFGDRKFDKILMIGVLHHLNDGEAQAVLSACSKILSPKGQIITSDPLIEKKQHPIARLLALMDQGNYVRTLEGYAKLVSPFFSQVDVKVRRDFLRLPYTHHLMVIEH